MGVEVLVARPAQREVEHTKEKSVKPSAARWDPDAFAREQIRGLVRQVFFSNLEKRVRQVVLSAVDPQTDLKSICRNISEALARETDRSVAVVGESRHTRSDGDSYASDTVKPEPIANLRHDAVQVESNLWRVPAVGSEGGIATTTAMHLFMGALRTEFDYSIIAAPSAGDSNETAAMAQLADGIVLVLSAHRTRRILARKVKATLEAAEARVLGVVLNDRDFPMPEGIYRRL